MAKLATTMSDQKAPAHQQTMEIIDLPHDIFLLVIAHFSTRTNVLCRRVSRRWNAAFTDQNLSLQLLKWHFPRCREMRIAYSDEVLGRTGKSRVDPLDWTALFARVAHRYHHLRNATPREIDKIPLHTGGGFHGVATWDRYLRLDDKTAPFHYSDPRWCYDADAGLLVYRPGTRISRGEDGEVITHYPWVLFDLETRQESRIPFPHDDGERIVRRVRLNDGVLVFEWCEAQAYHQLNDREECHRHYVTVFDIVHPTEANKSITHRATFKLHFLGLPLNATDRFLSAHSNTHYAVYIWQPNRSIWGDEDDPLESLLLWDISLPQRPRIIRRMTWSTLAFYGVRQRATPRLRSLGLDGSHLFFIEEEHRWARGGQSSLTPPRVHLVRSTGIPVLPMTSTTTQGEEGELDAKDELVVQGPVWLDECGANGDVNLSFCSRIRGHFPSSFHYATSPGIWNTTPPSLPSSTLPNHPPTASFTQELVTAQRTPTTRWPGWAPCWRHEEFPYLTVSEMVDFRAGVRVTARHCFMLETLSVHVRPLLCFRGLGDGADSVSISSSSSSSSSATGEDNTYCATRNESYLGAGPAARAREDKLPMGAKDAAKAHGAGLDQGQAGANGARSGGGDGMKQRANRANGSEADVGDNEEVQFADEMWDELLGRGYICGDERWLVGEDKQGQITVVRF